mmetsp:Transcript_15333/g.38250  ORF Transcript_15333/g.38250 Transcript_15333/m.38250 type:complete len:343 (+) Transcript_15333:1218-2246(+)
MYSGDGPWNSQAEEDIHGVAASDIADGRVCSGLLHGCDLGGKGVRQRSSQSHNRDSRDGIWQIQATTHQRRQVPDDRCDPSDEDQCDAKAKPSSAIGRRWYHGEEQLPRQGDKMDGPIGNRGFSGIIFVSIDRAHCHDELVFPCIVAFGKCIQVDGCVESTHDGCSHHRTLGDCRDGHAARRRLGIDNWIAVVLIGDDDEKCVRRLHRASRLDLDFDDLVHHLVGKGEDAFGHEEVAVYARRGGLGAEAALELAVGTVEALHEDLEVGLLIPRGLVRHLGHLHAKLTSPMLSFALRLHIDLGPSTILCDDNPGLVLQPCHGLNALMIIDRYPVRLRRIIFLI